MKTISFGLSFLLSITIHLTHAQPYWVIETNARQKSFTIVRFYDEHHALIHEERQHGVYLNPLKKRHKRRLDAMLQFYLTTDAIYSKSGGSRNGKGAKKPEGFTWPELQ